MATYGFIGLGNMGGPMAANLQRKGFPLTVFDAAGTEARAPKDAEIATDVAGVAASADTVFLSLPSGKEVASVADAILAAPNRKTTAVVDFSTIGPSAAEAVAETLAAAGIALVDAPVSGGTKGAADGTLAVMCGCPDALFGTIKPALEAVGKNVFHVGSRAGQGQAMKCLNNYLGATNFASMCEALLFGERYGLDFRTTLAVLNESSGKSSASMGRLPDFIEDRSFKAGFAMALMAKDAGLYRDHAEQAGIPHGIAETVAATWREALTEMPDADFTAIYKYFEDHAK